MKYLFLFIFLIQTLFVSAQLKPLEAGQYSFSKGQKFNNKSGSSISIIKEKSTQFLDKLNINQIILNPGRSLKPEHFDHNLEKLILINQGELTVTINKKSSALKAGSVVLILTSDTYSLSNLNKTETTCTILSYTSKKNNSDKEHGKSTIYNIEDIPFKKTEKGGRRDFFNRATFMLERLELHITYLNEGLESHPPHRHIAEEIILLLDGSAKESIDGIEYLGSQKDFFFLPSNSFHGIKNSGLGQNSYFAFQFN